MLRLFESVLERLLSLPDQAVYGIIGVLAAVENVFPPIPADTAVGLGAYLSHHGTVLAGVVFLVTWAGNLVGAVGVYVAGRTFGRQFFTGRLGSRLLHPRHLRRLEHIYARHGVWGVFVSRFLPGLRAVVPPFAGVARLSVFKAMVPIAVASGIWYGTLTWLVAASAGEIDEVVRVVARLNWTLLAVALVIVAIAVWVMRDRREKLSASEEPDVVRPKPDGTGSGVR